MAAAVTELTDNLAYGVDLKNRRLYFGVNLDTEDTDVATDFSISSVEYAIRAIHRMVADAPAKPIEIHMCSYGGDPYAMLRLYDEIHACPCQIKFIGGGAIMSAATWIMCGADERYLHPNCTVMVHDGSDDFDGKHTDHQLFAGEMKRLQDRLYEIYAENSRMPKEFWQDVCQRDMYLTASEAVSLGLADKIIEPKKRGNLRKARQAVLKKTPDSFEMQKMVDSLYARINKTNVPKIELNDVKKEPVDASIVIDNTPQIEKPVLESSEINKTDVRE